MFCKFWQISDIILYKDVYIYLKLKSNKKWEIANVKFINNVCRILGPFFFVKHEKYNLLPDF